MKKILYVLLLVSASAMTITSCTEEEVKPKHEDTGGDNGGTGGDPIKNG